MTKSILSVLAALLLSSIPLFAQTNNLQQGDAIIGQWINPDKSAKFDIYKKNGKYFGKIIWGNSRDTKDSKNPDPNLKKRDLIGLTILNDLVFEDRNTWINGTIYDPNDGKTYTCKLTLTSTNTLDVRGFLGVSLFGRTETWTKTN